MVTNTVTRTVTVPSSATGASGPTAARGSTSTQTTPSASGSTTPSTSPPPPTRTAPAPSFVTNPPGSGGTGADLASATAAVRRAGYSVSSTTSYHEDDTLRALIGKSAAGERVFFFDRTKYLGTDAARPSGHVTLTAQSDTEVSVRYTIYSRGAPVGAKTVRFALDMGMLSALDAIPSAAARSQD